MNKFDKGVYRTARDAWYNYTKETNKPYLMEVALPNHDGNLNIAEPWHDFGNYPSVGVEENDTIVRMNGLVYDITKKKAWKIKEEGSWWNHSENNDTPGRVAFGDETSYTNDVETVYSEYNNFKKEYEVEHKAYELQQANASVGSCEMALKKIMEELVTLQKDHPRAYRQIANKQIEIAHWEKRLASARSRVEYLEAN